MKNKKFRQIVSTKLYKTVYREDYPDQKIYVWENTHKLLWSKGVTGIKTGITTSAGPCLATALTREGYDLIIILLCCKSLDARWVETNKLANWSITRLKKIKKFQTTLPPNAATGENN